MHKILTDYTHTWKVITIFATIAAALSILFFAFEQRQPIIEAITGHKLYAKSSTIGPPSEATQKQLTDFTDSHPLVVAVSIGKASFELNTRQPIFQYSKIAEITASWALTGETPSPLFGDDPLMNGRIVELINGKFVCSPTKETVGAQLHPIIGDYSAMTCSMAIPPGYGDFLGWINIYLSSAPTFNQLNALQKTVEQMSKDIYERDVLHGKLQTGTANDAVPLVQ